MPGRERRQPPAAVRAAPHPQRWLVRRFSLRTAVVFVLVGVGLHLVMERLVEDHFREHAEFHAVFVAEAVLEPRLAERLAPSGGGSPDGETLADRLHAYAVAEDEAVYHVTIWRPDGSMLASSEATELGASAPEGSPVGEVARSGTAQSREGPAPHLDGEPPVDSTIRTFTRLQAGQEPLVAEIHQDWSPTLAASRRFSGSLSAGLAAGLALLWALSLPIVRQAGRQIHERSRIDQLTALRNRAALEERLDEALRRLERTPRCLALMFIDLDGFKAVNDALGHGLGDHVLREVSARILACTRDGDLVARFAGDEFVVVLEDVEDDEAERIACRLVDAIRQPLEDLPHHGVTASVGVAMTSEPTTTGQRLLRDADAAMYHVKERGGDGCQVFDDELRSKVAHRQRLEQDVRGAAGRGELRLAFQPFMATSPRPGAPVAVEALVRWDHPRLGPIPPGEFVPVAERTGAISDVGAWVLREACRRLAEWQEEIPDDREFGVYVNLSPAQLDERLLDVVDEALRSTGAQPRRLGLEITESALMPHVDAEATSVLERLRARGCRLALDDFGTGHSSLSRLRTLPLDLLKLDRSFVGALETGERELPILRTVVDLARDLEVAVLAEGVETEAQLRAVVACGFDLVQGYLLARPAPAHHVRRWLAGEAAASASAPAPTRPAARP